MLGLLKVSESTVGSKLFKFQLYRKSFTGEMQTPSEINNSSYATSTLN